MAKIKEKLLNITYKIENNFFLTVIRHGLTMMIPLLLIGGIACALINLPFVDYEALPVFYRHVHYILNLIYHGTFSLFSFALVIVLSLSYGMEKNETIDNICLYIIASLCAYGSQLDISSPRFDLNTVGTTGCFAALFITLITCFLYEKIKSHPAFSFRGYALGMNNICANAINSIIPITIAVGIIVIFNRSLFFSFGVSNLNELFSTLLCIFVSDIEDNFNSGFIYTLILHVLWILGFHGSHILEPVAQTTFSPVAEDIIFSKSFFDTYVVMGGCGTTICVFIVLLLFFRKDRMGNYAKIASFSIIFNLNEVLNFGIPIVLNPILAIPFITTPIVIYCIAYFSTVIGLVPPITNTVPWSTPIILSGYLGTGSIKGSILQIVCIFIGMAIYYPFLRVHKKFQEAISGDKIKRLINELQEYEKNNETPQFLHRADSIGQISRMLLDDLKISIKQKKLFLMYQPQMDDEGTCLGAEALLRWIHPLYGFIYPPLIVHLAKEGNILQELEEFIFDTAASAIRKTSDEYDDDFKISVNITGKSLLWDIEACISENLKKYDIPANRLWLEITEQDVIANTDFVVKKLENLNGYGHTLLIDDFGMGHTSLIYLQSNYFGVVKLDGSLVKNVLDNKTNQKIIASIVKLGNELNVKVIAEYVETEEQRDLLKSLGCIWYQGYLYSKPVQLDEFIEQIKQNKK